MRRIRCVVILLLVITASVFLPIPQVTSELDITSNATANQGPSNISIDDLAEMTQESDEASISLEQVNTHQHKVTSLELNELKSDIGVFEEDQNFSQIIDGHGTGLRPPTEQEWVELAKTSSVIDKVYSAGSSPLSVDQSETAWFPPIGNQGSQGSCVAWSVGYYVKTFQEAKERQWSLTDAIWSLDAPTREYQSQIMSPAFIYNLQNEGKDQGLFYYKAINLVCSIGICSWEKMAYSDSDYTTWPSEEAWTEATLYRGADSAIQYMSLYNDEGLTNLKNWLASGNLATISVDADNLKASVLTSSDLLTLNNYVVDQTNHAGTVVGYDDTIAYIENGAIHYGAFKIANSWGEGSWENNADGFYWISYEAMKQRVEYCFVYNDIIGYIPELAASFSITHTKRGECTIEVGLGDENDPVAIKSFSEYINGGNYAFCTNDIVFDITELKDYMENVVDQTFFLKVYDAGTSTAGTINRFSIEYACSSEIYCPTINGNYVTLSVTLPPFETTWSSKSMVWSDNDYIDGKVATANDSTGNLYAAYSDEYQSTGKTAIFVSKSTDEGQTWSAIICGYDSAHNLGYPSLAVNAYNGEVYVACEREVTASDYDILVLRYVDNAWSWSEVSCVIGQNDRFPSITCEYQYDTGNWQYISYEYLEDTNDRDLMFAKSTDQGASWSISKLHGGGWFDWEVYSQTCIANEGGKIYIAYRYGADYDSISDIRVEKSLDFGATWTQITNIDNFSNDCQNPTILAAHDGSIVVVAFEYQFSSNDKDICYSYSTDNGATWIKQLSLFASIDWDETSVELSSDENGRIFAVCKAGRFSEYKVTSVADPTNWSSLKVVNDGWVGEGLAIGSHIVNNINYPYVLWTDTRTKSISFADGAQVIPTTCTLSASTICFGQLVNITGTIDAQVSDGTMNIDYSTDNSTWINLANTTPNLGAYTYTWSPTNIGTFFIRTSWSGDTNYKGAASTVQQLTVLANYTITTYPAGLQINVDNEEYTSPHTFNWAAGSSHTINVIPQNTTNCRYIFTAWDDSETETQTRIIIVDNVEKTYTADFKTQYLLSINAENAVSSGAGWYDSGATATFSVTPLIPTNTGTQYVFTLWTGTGEGAYTGTSTTQSVIMNNAITETANWQTQHQVTFATNPLGGGTITPNGANTWQNEGKITISATANSEYLFSSWTTTGSITVNQPTAISTTANISGPGTITANFQIKPAPTQTSSSSSSSSSHTSSSPVASPSTTIPELSFLSILILLTAATAIVVIISQKHLLKKERERKTEQ